MSHERNDEFDTMSVARYVDGEMTAAERARFAARLDADPELRRAVLELEDLRRCIAAAATTPVRQPCPGFRARVAAEVAGFGGAAGSREAAELERVMVFARRVMVAAVLVFGVAILMFAGLLRSTDSGRLEASPAEIQRAIEKLDAAIRVENTAGRAGVDRR
jgi:anti-sigma factor RsiW